MSSMSQNYRFRTRHLENDQMPSLNLIKKVMPPALANLYFMSLRPKMKILVGLEPPLKGGGNAWFVPPESLLKGSAVLKPLKKEVQENLSHKGIAKIGQRLHEIQRNRAKVEEEETLKEHNAHWISEMNIRIVQHLTEFSEQESENNQTYIQNAYDQFSVLYPTILDKIQKLVVREAENSAEKIREAAMKIMQAHYQYLLQQLTVMLTKRQEKQLMNEKEKLKKLFTERLSEYHQSLADKLHDINLEKHTAIEKLRQYLEMKTVACQVYIALKEQEYAKEVELTGKLNHERTMAIMTETLKAKDSEIKAAEQKEREWKELNLSWHRKVCSIVKHFQMFVSYSLRTLPEQADFFMNIEKLMLLQLSKVLEDPKSTSIIIMDEEGFDTPTPKPHPFYLFCDKGYKPKIDQDLCPKHCTSSASQLPVLVIDKRCIYSACDNFGQFTDKIQDYVNGNHNNGIDLQDYHDYSRDVPVKYTASQRLKELKLESSLFQVLQKEVINPRSVPIECCGCKIPHCFDCDRSLTISPQSSIESKQINISGISQQTPSDNKEPPSPASIKSGNKISTREDELKHEREPKLQSYSRYIESKKCGCAKMAKKPLLAHLPAYMRKMSAYGTPELLNYEKCSVSSLRSLVKKARGNKTPPPTPIVLSETKEMSTQYSDQEFDYICACLSHESVKYFCDNYKNWKKKSDSTSLDDQFRLVGGSLSPTFLINANEDFVTDRALSLKRLIDQSTAIKDIFEKNDCNSH